MAVIFRLFGLFLLVSLVAWPAYFADVTSAAAARKKVTIGYQKIPGPWLLGIVDQTYQKATGYDIKWKPYDSGRLAVEAIGTGEAQITFAGSSPIAIGASTGVNLELFWIVDNISSAEALIVRRGSRITAPQDLKGKTVAVPFGSTTHFHLLFALEQFNIPVDAVNIIDMQPSAIEQAWDDKIIDATFIWNPVLGNILKSGRILAHSGMLTRWGKATFDGLVVNKEWARANEAFMVNFVKSIARIDARYRANPRSWNAKSQQTAKIVALIGGRRDLVPRMMRLYKFPRISEQASRNWLGGGNAGGAALALFHASKFLKEQNIISNMLPDYGSAVTDEWVRSAMGR